MALIEKTADMANYSAWVPDLPGSMREDGAPIPVPSPAVALGEAQPGSIACAVLVPVPGEQTPAAA